LATQVLYFIGAFLILVAELTARIHVCCRDDRSARNLAGVGLLALVAGSLPAATL